MPFEASGRATILGETTGGSSGQPLALNFGDGFAARISAKREMFPDGRPFEGVGIAPDVAVSATPEQMRRGEGPVLARALALAGAKPH